MPHGGPRPNSGGFRPGSGRKPGSSPRTPNSVKNTVAEHAKKLVAVVAPEIASMSPLDVMLHAMALEAQADNWRAAASFAEKAAPYIHPRLATETLSVRTDDSQRSEDDLRRELEELDRRAAIADPERVVSKELPGESTSVVH